MARVSNRTAYPKDQNLEAGDFLLGTDVSGGLNATKTYDLSDLRDFINTGANVVQDVGAFYLPVITKDGTGVDFSNIRQYIVREESTDVTFGTGSAANIIDARVVYDSPTTVLQVFNWDNPWYIGSLVGTTISVTTSQGTHTGYISRRLEVSDTFAGATATPTGENDEQFDQKETQVWFEIVRTSSLTPNSSLPVTSMTISRRTDGDNTYSLQYLTINVGGDLSAKNITADGDLTAVNATASGTLSVTGDATFSDDITVENNITGNGDLTINNDAANTTVTFGDDRPNTNPAQVTVHGVLNIPDDEGELTFGQDADGNALFTFQVDTPVGDNDEQLSFTGAPDTTVSWGPDTTFTSNITVDTDTDSDSNLVISQDSIVITDAAGQERVSLTDSGLEVTNSDGTAGPALRNITANDFTASQLDSTTAATQQLSSIKINEQTFQLPELSAGVAEALPGLTETLGVTPTAITTGSFFRGLEQSNGATYQAEFTNIAGFAIGEGVSSVEIPTASVTNFEAARSEAQTNDEALFFIDSTDNLGSPDPGDVISASMIDIYEVIAYNSITNVMTFGLLGEGTLNLSTGTLNITSEEVQIHNIPSETYNSSEHNFVTIDTDNELSRSALDIQGTANGARYDFGTSTDQAIESIEFTGADYNISATTGDLTIDISGKTDVPTAIKANPSGNLLAGRTYILDTPDAGVGNVALNLPTNPSEGDFIKIVNLSTVSSDGNATTVDSRTYELSPGSSNRIMKAGMGEELVLDDPTASFEIIWSNQESIGWVIVGIN